MTYVFTNETCIAAADHAEARAVAAATPGARLVCAWDIASREDAEQIAAAATRDLGVRYLPVTYTNRSPKHDVIRAPAVGDPVSYGFNGDYYPCGYIAHVSPSYRVIIARETREDGSVRECKFYRQGETGLWLRHGTWALVHGHISRWNPEF